MESSTSTPNHQGMARRAFVKRLAALTGVTVGAALLNACQSSPPTPTTAATAAQRTAAPTTGAASAVTGSTTAGSTTSAASAVTGSTTTGASAVRPTTGVASASAGSPVTAASPAASTSAADTTAKIVAAANAFVATLSATEKGTGLFDWTNTAQKQRWSNFPPAGFQRAGLMWGNMNAAAQNAWLAIMQATLSTEGYNRVNAEWSADDALLAQQGTGGGFGRNNYFVALIGTPSTTSPWQWQWGGHHVTVNATIVGPNISLTPSFIGVQPATYTNASGNTIRPLGDIEDEGFALVTSLDPTQQKAAILGSTPIDLVLGPGQDGKTIQPEGLPASQMNASQQAAFVKLIGHYAGLATGAYAAGRVAEIMSGLNQTYFAWYGPTTKGSAAYFRATGPTVVIEYAPQGGGGGPGGGGPGGGGPGAGSPGAGGPGGSAGGSITDATTDHIHGIYRDPTNDYGVKYTK